MLHNEKSLQVQLIHFFQFRQLKQPHELQKDAVQYHVCDKI